MNGSRGLPSGSESGSIGCQALNALNLWQLQIVDAMIGLYLMLAH